MNDFTPIDEGELVRPLLGFAPFARFYETQRPRITGPIGWALRPGHPAAGSCRRVSLPMRGGRTAPGWLITLRERPRTLDAAHTVAHELMHCILDVEGWPTLQSARGAPPELDRIADGINGLVDVAIDKALTGYGFPSERAQLLGVLAQALGGPDAPAMLRHLTRLDLTDRATVEREMRALAAPSRGGLHVMTGRYPPWP